MEAEKIILGNFKQSCTGCATCQNVCPMNAISMELDTDGFLYPNIDNHKCIDCKLCQSKCPINNDGINVATDAPNCYAVAAKDEICLKCSSGGVFGAIAELFIKNDGYVSGAIYDESFNVHHVVTNKMEVLNKIIGSKYVQSETSNVYKEIKQLVKSGKKVLFCGCPCQVAGIKSVVGNDDNLYTMDLICHGVPSYHFYHKYLERYGAIKELNFRDKKVFGWSTEINLIKKNGEEIHLRHENDTFYKAFLPCLVQRESCAECKFSVLPRQGDLTIGDFWGIEKYDRQLFDKRGMSVVLTNTAKGEKLLKSNSNAFRVITNVPIEIASRVNKNIYHPFKAHFARERFFRDIKIVKDLDKLVNYSLSAHYDVGIVGLWFGLNFGSVLTYYALHEALREMGLCCLMINKPKFMWINRYEDPNSMAQRFIRKHCTVSMVRNSTEDYNELSNHCDTFVLGSDVVWNYDISGKTAGHFFFLDFVNNKNCRKIAYASSFGTGFYAPADYHALSNHYIHKFDAVSVREKEAADICEDAFGITPAIVMDPVFLCKREKYYDLASQSNLSLPTKYIGAYILGPDLIKKEMLQSIQAEIDLPVRILPNPNHDDGISAMQWENSDEIIHNGDVEDFLSLIKNCEYFFADSFHGLCFAILFKKKFISVTGKYQKDNCRFRNLLESLNLLDRLVFFEDYRENNLLIKQKIVQEIDYDKVYEIIEKRKETSMLWLKEALNKTPKQVDGLDDYFLEEMKVIKKRMQFNEEKTNRLYNLLNAVVVEAGIQMLTLISSPYDYLNCILKTISRKIVILSVRDTMGFHVDRVIADYFHKIGFDCDFSNKHWRPFIGIAGKTILYEDLGDENSIINYEKSFIFNENKINVKITSAPYKNRDFSSIVINGKEYSNNRRGFNIVVYDIERGVVEDSITLDTHIDPVGFSRLEEFSLI